MDFDEKIAHVHASSSQTMAGALGIEYISIEKDCLVASMPVDERTRQPFGILHGGASVALAETLASIGAWINLEDQSHRSVGIEINANHIRPASSGTVTGTARPIHIGRRTQVWEVRIENEQQELVSISRCTLVTIAKEL